MRKIDVSKIDVQQVVTVEVLEQLIAKYNLNEMTFLEVQQYAYAQLKFVYMQLKTNVQAYYKVNGYIYTVGTIIKREVVESLLKDIVKINVNAYKCFDYLKKLHVIDTCGEGYVLTVQAL